MTLKETVDKYLLKDFENINELKNSNSFRWIDVAKEIIEEHGNIFHETCKNCNVKKEDGES
jgi:NAD-dependent SIR2 family protein deacetylase